MRISELKHSHIGFVILPTSVIILGLLFPSQIFQGPLISTQNFVQGNLGKLPFIFDRLYMGSTIVYNYYSGEILCILRAVFKNGIKLTSPVQYRT